MLLYRDFGRELILHYNNIFSAVAPHWFHDIVFTPALGQEAKATLSSLNAVCSLR